MSFHVEANHFEESLFLYFIWYDTSTYDTLPSTVMEGFQMGPSKMIASLKLGGTFPLND